MFSGFTDAGFWWMAVTLELRNLAVPIHAASSPERKKSTHTLPLEPERIPYVSQRAGAPEGVACTLAAT